MTEEQAKAISNLKMHKDFAGMDNGCCVVNAKDVEIVLALIEKQVFKIASLSQMYNYDTKMIVDVKEEAVKLYNLIEEKDKTIEKQKEQIDYLRRSCERKEECLIEEQQENAELKNKLKEKDKIIDSMVEEFKEKTLMYTDFTEEIKQYFENKSKEV